MSDSLARLIRAAKSDLENHRKSIKARETMRSDLQAVKKDANACGDKKLEAQIADKLKALGTDDGSLRTRKMEDYLENLVKRRKEEDE